MHKFEFDYDFDEMVELAKKNPKAFSILKQEMCEELIRSSSTEMQERLRAQQSHIDRVVKHCKNPNQANIVLMRELSGQLDRFQYALLNGTYDSNETQTNQVIPFKLQDRQS